MLFSKRHRFTGIWIALSVLFLASAARADWALVVGNDHYPNMKAKGLADLEGCKNDAESIGDALNECGFHVEMLLNAAATRANIESALKSMKTRLKPSERFLFYFAGHGTRIRETPDGKELSALVPQDAVADHVNTVITMQTLFQWLKALPTARRAALLDCCYSEGMARARGLGNKAVRSRFIPFMNEDIEAHNAPFDSQKSLGLTVNQQDTNDPLRDRPSPAAAAKPDFLPDICYFAASRFNEEAREEFFNGKAHGVFTYYLAMFLRKRPHHWSQLQTLVSGAVVLQEDDRQHPTMTPQFVDKPLFEASEAANATAAQGLFSLWDVFCGDRINTGDLSLTMQPDQSIVKKDHDEIGFDITVQRRGYLVVLEHGTHDDVQLLYPLSGKAESAQMAAGDTLHIPPQADGPTFTPQEIGDEHIKAILFDSKDDAARLIGVFPPFHKRPELKVNPLPGVPWKKWAQQSRGIVLFTAPERIRFDTADLHFVVTAK